MRDAPRTLLRLVALLSATAAAAAEVDTGIAAERFVPAPGRSSIVGVEGAEVPPPGGLRFTFALGWAARPISVANRFTGAPVSRPVTGVAALDVTAEVGLTERLAIGIGLPVALFLAGDRLAGLGAPDENRPLASPLLGDLRLRAKLRLFRTAPVAATARRVSAGVALLATATFPVGGESDFFATSGPTFEPRLVGEVGTRWLGVAAQAGYRVSPERRVFDQRLGNEMHLGVGVDGHLPAGGDMRARFHMLAEVDWGGSHEFRGALRYGGGRFAVDAGVGVGIGSAVGTPGWRGFLIVRLE